MQNPEKSTDRLVQPLAPRSQREAIRSVADGGTVSIMSVDGGFKVVLRP